MTDPDPHPRFYVVEQGGYNISTASGVPGRPAWTTNVHVRDAWYCHRDVAHYRSSGNGRPLLLARRLLAEALARYLNAEHDAELARG